MSAEANNREPSNAHAAAIADLAELELAAQGSDLTIYRGAVPVVPRFPYAVFWGAPATPHAADSRMTGWGGSVSTTTQATVAGLTEADVLGAVDRLTAALHRRRPVIVGRRVGDFELDGAVARPQRDPVPAPSGQEVWATVLFFLLNSSPRRSTP